MNAEVTSALWDVEAAFVAHPARELLESCPVCGSSTALGDLDPSALVAVLGTTVGTPADVRALTPWLLHRAVGGLVDLRSVLARVAMFWDDWTEPERAAVRGVVDALWRAVLDRHPAHPPGTPAPVVAFLAEAAGLGEEPDRLLAIWEYKDTESADHHLAELLVEAYHGARVPPAALAWALQDPQRARVRRALDRDRLEPWAPDLAAAAALLPE